jgi:hypothetical protein
MTNAELITFTRRLSAGLLIDPTELTAFLEELALRCATPQVHEAARPALPAQVKTSLIRLAAAGKLQAPSFPTWLLHLIQQQECP